MVTIALLKTCSETSFVYFRFIIVIVAAYGKLSLRQERFIGQFSLHWQLHYLAFLDGVFRIMSLLCAL